jgi:hypothetical protein
MSRVSSPRDCVGIQKSMGRIITHADMQRLYRIDYNTDNNEHSPKCTLYDVGSGAVFALA